MRKLTNRQFDTVMAMYMSIVCTLLIVSLIPYLESSDEDSTEVTDDFEYPCDIMIDDEGRIRIISKTTLIWNVNIVNDDKTDENLLTDDG